MCLKELPVSLFVCCVLGKGASQEFFSLQLGMCRAGRCLCRGFVCLEASPTPAALSAQRPAQSCNFPHLLLIFPEVSEETEASSFSSQLSKSRPGCWKGDFDHLTVGHDVSTMVYKIVGKVMWPPFLARLAELEGENLEFGLAHEVWDLGGLVELQKKHRVKVSALEGERHGTSWHVAAQCNVPQRAKR